MEHIVTKLTESKNVKDRWYADLDTGESLKLSLALIADFSVYTGRRFEEEELEALRAAASKMNAKARALRMLGARAMSRKELTDKLLEKGETPEDAAEAADYLEAVGYLNDAQYAASLVRHYAQRGYGPGRVRQELYRRGVPRELWEEALGELPEDTDTLDALIERRLRGREADPKELKRLTDMLLRRGFSWSEIKAALGRLSLTEVTEDE